MGGCLGFHDLMNAHLFIYGIVCAETDWNWKEHQREK